VLLYHDRLTRLFCRWMNWALYQRKLPFNTVDRINNAKFPFDIVSEEESLLYPACNDIGNVASGQLSTIKHGL